MTKPLFKLKVFISQQRNLELLIWPEQQRDGKTYPPQPVLSQQRKKDDGEWEATTLYLTRKTIPELMAGLQIQYQALLALEGAMQTTPSPPSPAEPAPSKSEPTLAGKIFKAVTDEFSIAVEGLPGRFNASAKEVALALEELTAKNWVKVTTKGLKMYVEVP